MKNAKTICISFLLPIIYLGFVTIFFQGFGKAKYFDDIPDVLIITLNLTILITVLMRHRIRSKLLILGLLLIIVERLIEIPLQEYQLIQGKSPLEIWIGVDFIFFIGVLFLLMEFTKLYE